MNSIRQVVFGLWILCVVAGIGYYLANRAEFTPTHLAEFFRRHQPWFLLLYLVFLVMRAFVLLPATPLIIAGSLLMPAHPWTVLAITLLGLALSSTLIYYFSDWLGFRAHFERAAPKQIALVDRWLKHPLGVFIVAGCAFLMVVPTDLVCYVAGTVRMPFKRFLGALMVGEAILCGIYIFGSGWLSQQVM